MQTFLPYDDFRRTASVLDYRRLGKQRVEAKQILQTLDPAYTRNGWRNHPAVLMWKNYEPALAYYGTVICDEWIHRGYKDTLREWFIGYSALSVAMPPWMGDEAFHLSHRSNLLRKDFIHYSKWWPEVAPSLPYIWPSSTSSIG